MRLEPQLFLGDASEAEARVYASLTRSGLFDEVQLAGELIGPYCSNSQTLEARIRFADRGPGPTLLAEAVVPDPCFWTPELPFMYTAELRLSAKRDSPSMVDVVRQPFGIRRLGVQGSSIFLDAKRLVFRGVRLDTPTFDDLKTARKEASALYTETASDEFLEQASETGVLLAVSLHSQAHESELISQLVRIGRWPAVAVVVLDNDAPIGRGLTRAARNTLLAQRVDHRSNPVAELRLWANLAWCELAPGESVERLSSLSAPMIVCRLSEAETLAERRKNCDRLQADLAPLGDFSGYFV